MAPITSATHGYAEKDRSYGLNHDGSYTGKSWTRKQSRKVYNMLWVWTCDNCRTQGGMTVFIQHCPECQHLRCDHCVLELLRGNTVVFSSSSNDHDWGSTFIPRTPEPTLLPAPEAITSLEQSLGSLETPKSQSSLQ
jgi:hypothetical protein